MYSNDLSICERFHWVKKLNGLKRIGERQCIALCPGHDDHNPSLSLREHSGRLYVKCFAGCDRSLVLEKLGIGQADLRLAYPNLQTAADHLAEDLGGGSPGIWRYRDAHGDDVCAVARVDGPKGKTYRPFHKTARGWEIGDPPGPLPLYRLPELAHRPRIYIVEGEKCAEAAWSIGLVATTSAHGAKSPRKSDWSALAGGEIVILPDNNEAGRRYAAAVVQLVRKVGAASIRVVPLPDLPDGGDIVNFIHARPGKTPQELAAEIETLVGQTPIAAVSAALPPAVSDSDNLPVIVVPDRSLRDLTDDGLAALQQANQPPTVFYRAGGLARVRRDTAVPTIELYTPDSLRGRLARVANWVAPGDEDEPPRPVHPPVNVVKDILALGEWDFPVLDGVTTVPAFAPDGTLHLEPGYNAATRLFYGPNHGPLPDVPHQPTPAQVRAALNLIFDELLVDFPFVDDTSRAVALAALVLPFVRPMIAGPTPPHAIDAPTPGAGKGLIADVICSPSLDGSAPVMAPASSDEEWRKRITAQLSRGASVVLIDNVQTRLDSAALAAALTATVWTDRELGHSRTLVLPVRCTWLLTGNNLTFSRELARRAVVCRLDPRTDAPETRTGFRHPDLRRWAREHRAELIAAALVLVRAWLAADRPPGQQTLGSYEDWAAVVGGILETAGVRGLLEGRDTLLERVSEDVQEWRTFVALWHAAFGEREVGVGELYDQLVRDNPDVLATVLAGAPTEAGRRTKLGQEIRRRRDNVIGDWIITSTKPDGHGRQLYRLLPVESRPGVGKGVGCSNSPPNNDLPKVADSSDSTLTEAREGPIACGGAGSGAESRPVAEESEESAVCAQTPSSPTLAIADSSADSSPTPPTVTTPVSLSPSAANSAPGNDEQW